MLELITNQYIQQTILILCLFIIAHSTVSIIRKRIEKNNGTGKEKVILEIIKKTKNWFYFLIFSIGIYITILVLTKQTYKEPLTHGFFIIWTIVIATIISKAATALIHHTGNGKDKLQRVPHVLSWIINTIIYIVAGITILGYFEVEITPLIATLGIGGLAISLALQNTLSNFFAGLHILSDKPIKIGDYIKINDEVGGFIEDIGWRTTRICTLRNTSIIIPNSKLAESIIFNNSFQNEGYAFNFPCGVSYQSDLAKVEKVTVEVAKEIQKSIEGATKEFEPELQFTEFSDSNINFVIILRVDKYQYKPTIQHAFIKALKARYDKEGITISWPIRELHIAKEKIERKKIKIKRTRRR